VLKTVSFTLNSLCKTGEMAKTIGAVRGSTYTVSKSASAITKERYLKQMQPLLNVSVMKETNTGKINVGFTTYGNKHLYSDTFGRAKGLGKNDLKNLDKALEKSTFSGVSNRIEGRKDKIKKFYYFKDENKKLYYNVAEDVKRGKIHRYLYSVTNKIK